MKTKSPAKLDSIPRIFSFAYLLDKFLDSYPSVLREQAVAVLEHAGELLVSRADTA